MGCPAPAVHAHCHPSMEDPRRPVVVEGGRACRDGTAHLRAPALPPPAPPSELLPRSPFPVPRLLARLVDLELPHLFSGPKLPHPLLALRQPSRDHPQRRRLPYPTLPCLTTFLARRPPPPVFPSSSSTSPPPASHLHPSSLLSRRPSLPPIHPLSLSLISHCSAESPPSLPRPACCPSLVRGQRRRQVALGATSGVDADAPSTDSQTETRLTTLTTRTLNDLTTPLINQPLSLLSTTARLSLAASYRVYDASASCFFSLLFGHWFLFRPTYLPTYQAIHDPATYLPTYLPTYPYLGPEPSRPRPPCRA